MTARKQTLREEAVAFPRTLRKLAEEAATHPNVSNKEKKVLQEAVEQLDTSVEALANIFAAHDAMQLGDDWREPFDPDAPIHLWIALAAAFTIGGRVISNPIVGQIRAAHARQKGGLRTREVDKIVYYYAKEYLPSQLSAGEIAKKISKLVNHQLNKLELHLEENTIEKKVRKLRKSLGASE